MIEHYIVLLTGRNTVHEREQLATTVDAYTDGAAIAAFLQGRPATATALRDKKWISGIPTISPDDSHTSVVRPP
jgi:hypothetical protein